MSTTAPMTAAAPSTCCALAGRPCSRSRITSRTVSGRSEASAASVASTQPLSLRVIASFSNHSRTVSDDEERVAAAELVHAADEVVGQLLGPAVEPQRDQLARLALGRAAPGGMFHDLLALAKLRQQRLELRVAGAGRGRRSPAAARRSSRRRRPPGVGQRRGEVPQAGRASSCRPIAGPRSSGRPAGGSRPRGRRPTRRGRCSRPRGRNRPGWYASPGRYLRSSGAMRSSSPR